MSLKAIPDKYYSWLKYILVGSGIILTFSCIYQIFAAIYSQPRLIISDEVNNSMTIGLANVLEEQIKEWQPGLFLETYAVTYQIAGPEPPFLTGQANFRFAGRRQDWMGNWLSQFNANHVILRVGVSVEQRKIVDYSYSHGQPFGFDAPLNLVDWPINERELLKICGQYGGNDFQTAFEVEFVHVDADFTRPGRGWTVAYSDNASPKYFNCLVNIDSGEISIKSEYNDWQNVGNLYSNR